MSREPTLPGVDEGLIAQEQLAHVREFFGLPDDASVTRGLRAVWPKLIAAQERYEIASAKLDRLLEAARRCGPGCVCPVHDLVTQ